MTYLRNCWYIASWAEELEAGKPLARKILDTPVVLFRDEGGVPHAIFDRCPHRFAPLSMGKVENGNIVCGYHGLAFGGSGACAVNPHGSVLANMSLPSYRVHETHRAIWIWMGEQEKADPALIPDFGLFNEVPDSAFSSGLIHSGGNYELFSDNLLDLTHADFLHANTVMAAPFTGIKKKVSEENDIVTIEYSVYNEPPNVLARNAPGIGERVDQRVRLSWEAPGSMFLRIEFVPAGSPPETPYIGLYNVHAVTPESATSTHYFFASTRNFQMDDTEMNALIGKTRKAIFEAEDAPMIAAQQANIGERSLWDLNPITFRSDDAGVRARRVIERRIRAEQAGRGKVAA